MAGKAFQGPLSEYKSKYLRCRGRRNHPWKVKTDFNITTKRVKGEDRITEFTQILHCALCTTDRKDTYRVRADGGFEKIRTSYDYAEGYQIHRGSRVTLEEARDALVMRELAGALDNELVNRLLNMRPEHRNQPKLRVVGA